MEWLENTQDNVLAVVFILVAIIGILVIAFIVYQLTTSDMIDDDFWKQYQLKRKQDGNYPGI